MQIAVEMMLFCLGLLMLKVKMKNRFAILVFAAICLRNVTVPFIPFGAASFYLANCFALSCLPNLKRHVATVRHTVLYWLVILQFIASVVLVVHSPHYDTPFQWARLVEFEFIGYALLAAMSFLCIREEEDLRPAIKWAIIGVLLLTAIGVVNYITKYSFWINTFATAQFGEQNAGEHYLYSDRFRVQAMFQNPFDYGFLSVVLACFFFYTWRKGLLSTKWFWIGMACCLFGTFFCGCRTVHVMFLLTAMVFVLCAFKVRQWLLAVFFIGLLALIVLPQMEFFQKYMDLFSKALNTNMRTAEGGSSLAMRALQFETVLFYIRDHMVFGRGVSFFNIDLGWADRSQGLVDAVDRDLFGLEGAYLNRLLERGFFGFAVYLVFYLTLFIAAYKRRQADKLTYALGTSVLAAYFWFAQATGELASVYPTMIFVGAALRLLYEKEKAAKEYMDVDDIEDDILVADPEEITASPCASPS